MQAAADGTTALGAVGGAAEHTRLDATLQVGGIVGGHFGEKTIVGIAGGMNDGASDALVRQELGIFPGEDRQLARDEFAII